MGSNENRRRKLGPAIDEENASKAHAASRQGTTLDRNAERHEASYPTEAGRASGTADENAAKHRRTPTVVSQATPEKAETHASTHEAAAAANKEACTCDPDEAQATRANKNGDQPGTNTVAKTRHTDLANAQAT